MHHGPCPVGQVPVPQSVGGVRGQQRRGYRVADRLALLCRSQEEGDAEGARCDRAPQGLRGLADQRLRLSDGGAQLSLREDTGVVRRRPLPHQAVCARRSHQDVRSAQRGPRPVRAGLQRTGGPLVHRRLLPHLHAVRRLSQILLPAQGGGMEADQHRAQGRERAHGTRPVREGAPDRLAGADRIGTAAEGPGRDPESRKAASTGSRSGWGR